MYINIKQTNTKTSQGALSLESMFPSMVGVYANKDTEVFLDILRCENK